MISNVATPLLKAYIIQVFIESISDNFTGRGILHTNYGKSAPKRDKTMHWLYGLNANLVKFTFLELKIRHKLAKLNKFRLNIISLEIEYKQTKWRHGRSELHNHENVHEKIREI